MCIFYCRSLQLHLTTLTFTMSVILRFIVVCATNVMWMYYGVCYCRGLMEIWKMLLQKTEEAARARMNVSEMLLSQVSEEMRQQKRIKEQSFKRVGGGRGGGREGGECDRGTL